MNHVDMVEEALRRASDTKALEFGAGATSRTGKIFKELFPGRMPLSWRIRIHGRQQVKRHFKVSKPKAFDKGNL